MSGAFIFSVANTFFPNRVFDGIKWVLLTAFFGLSVVGVFSFLKGARSVLNAHLYTAVSIYLLLGLLWFALYSAIEDFYPGSILRSSSMAMAARPSELLYFSLITLSTVGYGDVVPLYAEVRILAALEGITGPNGSYLFAPALPRTLVDLNNYQPQPISDHSTKDRVFAIQGHCYVCNQNQCLRCWSGFNQRLRSAACRHPLTAPQ